MTVADAIAQYFAQKGYTHAFGIIGAGNLALFDAIARLGKTEIVCCHHEQACAMAGDYYWRTVGRISPVIVTTGAGSSNSITGVMAAYMDSSPLLVISGNETLVSLNGDTRVKGVQGYESDKLAAGFCKEARRMTSPVGVANDLQSIIDVALKPRMGPVWLNIPRDVQAMEAA